MTARSLVLTWLPHFGATIQFRYDPVLVELLKTVVPSPWRTYESTTKTWTIHDDGCVDAFARMANRNGYAIETRNGLLRDARRPRHEQSRKAANPTRSSSVVWAEALFAAVGKDRQDAVYKALSRVLHPDVGGDTALMQALNDARRRAA